MKCDFAFGRIGGKLSPDAGGSSGGNGDCGGRVYRGPRFMAQLALSEDGQDLIEYALIVAVIALCVAGSMQTFTSRVGNEFSSLGSYM